MTKRATKRRSGEATEGNAKDLFPPSSLRRFVAASLLMLALVHPLHAEISVKGISLAEEGRGGAYGGDACKEQLTRIKEIGGNWIAINPFAWMRAVDDPHVTFRRGRDWDEDGMARCIADAHSMGIKVLLKPHIWCNQFGNGNKWHGDIAMKTEADWETWFHEYGDYILASAKVAQASKCDALCVGVEYQGTSATQEKRWRKLIADVRQLYRGNLTYAASWGEYPDVKWWDALDCIGVDAYFPLALQAHPSDDDLRAGWNKIYVQLEAVSKQWGKPICFTEIGYSESSKAAAEPWKYGLEERDPELRARLFKIACEEAAKHDCICGLFVWKWFTGSHDRGWGRGDPFAIQNADQIVQTLKTAWKH